jgi:hypothetical protein
MIFILILYKLNKETGMKNSIHLLALLLIIFSTKVDSQWTHSSSGMHNLSVYSIAANETKIFAGTPEALSVSINNGVSWYLTTFNSQIEPVHSLFVVGENIFAGVQGYGLTVSANNGGYWTFHHPVGNRTIYSIVHGNGFVFAGASAMNPGSGPAAVHRSPDNGYTFNHTSLEGKIVLSLVIVNSMIFAGTQNEGVYVSANDGANWTQTSLNNQTIKSLAAGGGLIFAGTLSNGVYISSNNGADWIQSSFNNADANALVVNENSVFAASSSVSSFFVSTNNGISWTQKNEGMEGQTVTSLCIQGDYLFAGTLFNGVYRRPISDLVSIQPVSTEIPNEYSLSQNYPNPFNPETKIKFSIPTVGNGRDRSIMLIYDALGREIETLVNEQLNPGTYEVNWNASNHPSGVYFYRLSSGAFSQTNKMILIR